MLDFILMSWCLGIASNYASATTSSFHPNAELSKIATDMWNADVNSCLPEIDYEIDIQGYVTSTKNLKTDRARSGLFSWINEKEILNRPTYKAFKALLDNYERSTRSAETVTSQEKKENLNFIDAIMQTNVMKMCHNFLKQKRKAPSSVTDFKKQLYKIWFEIYKRKKADRNVNSSGFEHVFVGETRDHDVIGFHNWIQFYLQEKYGNIDYRGFFKRGTTEEYEKQPHMITLQFYWKSGSGSPPVKPIGSTFIGTSPEFEMALYTLVFLMDKGDKVQMKIDDYKVEIHCFPHGQGIGTAYPQSMDG